METAYLSCSSEIFSTGKQILVEIFQPNSCYKLRQNFRYLYANECNEPNEREREMCLPQPQSMYREWYIQLKTNHYDTGKFSEDGRGFGSHKSSFAVAIFVYSNPKDSPEPRIRAVTFIPQPPVQRRNQILATEFQFLIHRAAVGTSRGMSNGRRRGAPST
ncbi:hypothetical protein CDAR_582371 [Caerostris darwini]|uniref:Uncharacterized protein n=1 Tax=Caerostris darwini TaxID=1538125 RepID=A0AAV4RGW1_9ARAC|nr:hypothetical protein CDAR_582371 [Caerostris darwini]